MLLNELEINHKDLKPNDMNPIDAKLEEVMKWININCSQFMKISKSCGEVLYRGIKNSDKQIFIGYPRENRKSIEDFTDDHSGSATIAMRRCDEYLKLMGFKALRGNSIFCNSDYENAENWGKPFVIFPINGFTFTYSMLHSYETAEGYDDPYNKVTSLMRQVYNSFKYDLDESGKDSNVIDELEKLYCIYSATSIEANEITAFINNAILITKKFSMPLDININFNLKRLIMISNELSMDKPLLAKNFVLNNKMKNTNLKWTMKKYYDVLIHGAYVAIDNELYAEYMRNHDTE